MKKKFGNLSHDDIFLKILEIALVVFVILAAILIILYIISIIDCFISCM